MPRHKKRIMVGVFKYLKIKRRRRRRGEAQMITIDHKAGGEYANSLSDHTSRGWGGG